MKPGVFWRDWKRVGKKFTDLNFIVKKPKTQSITHMPVYHYIETVICVANLVKD